MRPPLVRAGRATFGDMSSPITPWWAERYEAMAAVHPSFAGEVDLHAEAQVDSLVSTLGLRAGARVLDVGCGAGRHAVLLQERGILTTGVDLSPRILRLASAAWEARQAGRPGPHFVPGDMRWLPVSGPFEAALYMDMALGVFDDEEEHLQCLRSARSVLVPGGKVLIELFNPYWWAREARTRHFAPGELVADADVVRRYRFDPLRGRVEDRILVFRQGGARGAARPEPACMDPHGDHRPAAGGRLHPGARLRLGRLGAPGGRQRAARPGQRVHVGCGQGARVSRGGRLPSDLVSALEGERDAALDALEFERERAEHAIRRAETLRAESSGLRAQIRELISESHRSETRAVAAEHTLARRRLPDDTGQLTEQLQLALDSSRRLARERDQVMARLKKVTGERDELALANERLSARVRALEGERRVARDES